MYGTIGPAGTPNSTYSLDDSAPVIHGAARFSPAVYHTLFYQSPTLTSGTHSLVVTYLNGTGTLWIDYFLFLPLPNSTVPPETSSRTTAVSSSRAIVTGSRSSSQSAFVSNSGIGAAQQTSNSPAGTAPALTAADRTKIGAAVGGVLGGLVLLVLVGAVIYYRRLALKYQKLASEPSVYLFNLLADCNSPRSEKDVEPFPATQGPYPYAGPSMPSFKSMHVSNPTSSMNAPAVPVSSRVRGSL